MNTASPTEPGWGSVAVVPRSPRHPRVIDQPEEDAMISPALLLFVLTGCEAAIEERADPAPGETLDREGTSPQGQVKQPADPRVPPRPAAPPVVASAAAAVDRDLQWVELRGRLVVIETPGAGKARRFTHLRLDDGQNVNLTYGGPPAGWEALVGKRLSVVGLLTLCGDLDGGQSTGGPHLAKWEEPRVLEEQTPPAGSSEAAPGTNHPCLGPD